MTVEPSTDADGNEVAFLYNWDGSGQDGDDLYFNVSLNGETYSFVVESYLCDNTTDVYKAVKELQVETSSTWRLPVLVRGRKPAYYFGKGSGIKGSKSFFGITSKEVILFRMI